MNERELPFLSNPSADAASVLPSFHLSHRTTWTRRAVLFSALSAAAIKRPLFAMAQTTRDKIVEQLLDDMSLERRVAQLFVFQAQGTDMTPGFEDQLKAVRPGGIIFVAPNIGNNDQIKRFVQAIHHSNQKTPPYIAIDQEGGDVIRLGGDPAPGAMELGRLSGDDTRAKSRDRARFLAGFGFDINFAPVADVAYQANSTMYLRSFGNDPKAVAASVSQFVRGSRQLRVMGAAKHYPGHGRTAVDSHNAVPDIDISWNDWKSSDALPFKAAIEAGVEMVMVGHLHYSQWDDQPTSLSKYAVKTLRDKLGFEGVIVTDDLGMGALAGRDPFDVLDRATDAGMDVLLYTVPPVAWDALVGHVAKRVRDGDVSEKRINASVRRILRLKVGHFDLTHKDDD
jgi:beta-N-acetylhexosaminidase